MQPIRPPPRELILEQLERMLASGTFAGAERSRAFLRFLVLQVLENQSDRLKEYTIGSEALGRGDSFDPRIDPIVRAEASPLRSRIERYYATDGVADTVLITLPKGSYVPQVHSRSLSEAPVAAKAGTPHSSGAGLQRLIFAVGWHEDATGSGGDIWPLSPRRVPAVLSGVASPGSSRCRPEGRNDIDENR